MPKSIIDLKATKENAINEINDLIDNRLLSYESMRNYDLGENNHQNVSLLSPYIRHRLITEQEVISAALNKFPLPKIEKFIHTEKLKVFSLKPFEISSLSGKWIPFLPSNSKAFSC